MTWFNEKELSCRCCGQLPPFARENMEALVRDVLDPAREKLGMPIRMNSGYRCIKHNVEVGGVERSQHLRGEAADITCADNARLALILEELGNYDQLIRYENADGSIRFIHVSWKRTGSNRKQKMFKK